MNKRINLCAKPEQNMSYLHIENLVKWEEDLGIVVSHPEKTSSLAYDVRKHPQRIICITFLEILLLEEMPR